MVFYYAFTDKSGAFTLDNVTRLTNYTSTFLRSLWFGIVATIICLLIAYPLAYILSKMKLRAQSTMVMLVMIPMWMNFLLRTYAWMTLLEDSGVINSILAKINIGPFHMINTSGAVILGMVYNFLPYMILPIYSVMTKLDNSLIEAAQDLGCPPVKAFIKVVLPSILPGVIAGLIMAFTLSFDDFIISYFVSGPKFQTLPIRIFSMTKKRVTPDMYALSTIMFIVILVLLVLVNVLQAQGDNRKEKKGGAAKL